MATVNESLLDAAISHQIGLQRYTTATLRKMIALLNRSEQNILAQLINMDPTAVRGSYAARRLEKVLEGLKTASDEATKSMTTALNTDLQALAVYEVEYQIKAVQYAVPVKLDIVSPANTQLYAAVNSRPFQGRLLKEWYSGFSDASQRRLRESVRAGFTEGQTIDQMVRAIRGTAANQYRDGVMEITRRGAEALVRTAVNHTANAARNELYRQNDDLIEGERWVATLDGRTTLLCASRDGKVYPPDSGPRPPAHINCRSTTVPVLKSWKSLGINLAQAPEGTRASMNGQVPTSETYNTWLKKQPVSFQDDILGVTKGKLYRSGGLSLDKFVDRNGAEYTLDQLRTREAEAFRKAGLDA